MANNGTKFTQLERKKKQRIIWKSQGICNLCGKEDVSKLKTLHCKKCLAIFKKSREKIKSLNADNTHSEVNNE